MRAILIIICIVLVGCKNANNEKAVSYSEMEDISTETFSTDDLFEKPDYSQLNLIEEKLQETYDLVYLYENNSDFESTIKSSTLIDSNLILDNLNNENSLRINNLVQIGRLETINDSTDSVNFSYTLKQGNSEKIDTLKAIIKKQNIIIEDQTTTSIKIDFTKPND